MSRPPRQLPLPALMTGVVLVSGAVSLVYQVVWFRELRLVFGYSTAATAAVLAIFMGGLGLGGLVLGRRVDAKRLPLLFYARLELGIAVAAALSPWLIDLLRAVYIHVGGTPALGAVGGTLLRLVASAVVLGVATFLMGGTLPAAVRAIETATDRARRFTGLLYGANTAGAVVGAFAATFLLLELVGSRYALWSASALNLALAGAVWTLAAAQVRRGAVEPPAAAVAPDLHATRPAYVPPEDPRLKRQPSVAAARPAEAPAASGTPAALVLAAAFGVGFVFFAMELVWYRMLNPLLGGTLYTFGLILSVALLGIGAGGLVYARGRRERRPTLLAFAVTCVLEALFVIAPFALGDELAIIAALVQEAARLGFASLVLAWTLIASLVVLPASIVAGYQFPLLVSLLGEGRERVGAQVGLAYACNTGGAILGALVGGFVLIPGLGAPTTWRAMTALLLVLGVAALALAPPREPGARPALAAAAALLVAVLALADGPTPLWRHSGIGAGRFEVGQVRGRNDYERLRNEYRRQTAWETDGVESSLALLETDGYSVIVNGKSDGNVRADLPTNLALGLVPALLHGEPRRALVVGLGTGVTAGWLAQIDSIERVDVVELEPAVAEAARRCGPANHDALDDPRVRLVVGDAREVLLTGGEPYDLIVSQPSNPYRAGVSSLYTREFYEAVARRLAPGGVFAQWLQAYEVDLATIGLVTATLADAFPHVEIWEAGLDVDLVLVASGEALDHDPTRLAEALRREPFRTGFDLAWGVHGLPGFYTGYLAGPPLARLYQEASSVRNTDERTLAEFRFARALRGPGRFQGLALRRHAAEAEAGGPAVLPGVVDWEAVEEARSLRFLAEDRHPEPLAEGDPGARSRVRAREAYSRGDFQSAARAWMAQDAPPVASLDVLLTGHLLAREGDERARDFAAHLDGRFPVEARLVETVLELRVAGPAAAAERLGALFATARRDVRFRRQALRQALALAEELVEEEPAVGEALLEALADPFTVAIFEDRRWRTRVEIAVRLELPPACVGIFGEAEPHPEWSARFLGLRADCYARHGSPLAADAERDLERFRRRAGPGG